MVWYGDACCVLSRPLPCWVRSHGRSKILIKISLFACSGVRSHGVFLFPGFSPFLASASYAFSFSSTTTTITFSAHTIFSAMDKNTTQRSFSSTPSVSLIVRIDVNKENRQQEERETWWLCLTHGD